MVDPSILKRQAFKLNQEDFFSEIKKGAEYVCDICHKCEYKENVLRSVTFRYGTQVFDKCHTAKCE